jgi:BirA family biotin operon repressor/biotin-[acetyl-CoA-carboxylase] ligase
MSLPLVEDVQDRLSTDRLGAPMRGVEELGSTNEAAVAWARDGAPDGAVVLTEHQTTGRGRHGRTWTADKGQNLLFSVVLRPELAPDRLSLITVAASVAVAETIEQFVSPFRAGIEWPNDVLLDGRKTCGILLESSLAPPNGDAVVVLGVGLNVNQTDFPDALADTATSLRLTTGRPIPRAELLAHLLRAIERRYDAVQPPRPSGEAVRAAFEDRLASLHEPTTLRVPDTDQTLSGTVEGITDTGALRLRTAEGTTTVHAGNVTTRH